MKVNIFFLGIALFWSIGIKTGVEIVDLNYHQFVPHIKDNPIDNVILAKLILYSSEKTKPSLHTKKRGDVYEYTFVFSDFLIKSNKVKKNIDAINAHEHNLYSIKIKQDEKNKLFSLIFSFNPQIVALQEWPLTSIKGQPGIEFRFINKSAITVAEKQLSEKRATKIAFAKKPKIVIDAGHGGRDPGACGMYGIYEKDVVLSISFFLKNELTSHNADVCLTRSNDSYVYLSDRTYFANSYEPDCVISLHANGSSNKKLFGLEIYYPDIYKDDPLFSTIEECNPLLTEWIMLHQEQSKEFARYIEKNLNAKIETLNLAFKNNTIKPAFSQFLLGINAPVILVEVGFITNEKEALLLNDSEYQKNIASALARGVLSFVKNRRNLF